MKITNLITLAFIIMSLANCGHGNGLVNSDIESDTATIIPHLHLAADISPNCVGAGGGGVIHTISNN